MAKHFDIFHHSNTVLQDKYESFGKSHFFIYRECQQNARHAAQTYVQRCSGMFSNFLYSYLDYCLF